MKFGEKSNLYKLPKWEQFYVPYDRLKVLLKKASTSSPRDFKDFESCFTTSIGVVEEFLRDHYAFISNKERDIDYQYRLDKSGSETFYGVLPPALEETRIYYNSRLKYDYLELQLFARWNQEATDRILNKLKETDQERFESFKNQDILKSWDCFYRMSPRPVVPRPMFPSRLEFVHQEFISKPWDSFHFERPCLLSIEELPTLMSSIDQAYRQHRWSAVGPKIQGTEPSISSDPERTIKIMASPNPADASLSHDVEITPALLQQLDISMSPESFQDILQEFPGMPQNAFHMAIYCGAWKCANFLLQSGFVAKISAKNCLENHCNYVDVRGKYCMENVLEQRECLDSLIQIICEGPRPLGRYKGSPQSVDQVVEDATYLYRQLMHHIGPRGQIYLQEQHEIGERLPLHHCSESGSFELCSLMEKFSREYEQGSSAAFAKHIMTKDFEGFTPLQLAVDSGHVEIVQLYISILKEQASADQSTFRSTLSEILLKAVQLQNDAMFNLITTTDVDITHQPSYNGETALHVAARLGREDYVRELLKIARRQIACIDRPDSVREWTPLCVASASGNLPLVELFIQAGADKTRTDHAGWTAQEHAAFRGHLAVAEKLRPTEAIEAPKLLNPGVPEAQKVDLPSNSSVFVLNLGPMQQNRRAIDDDFKILQQKFPDAVLSLEILPSSDPTQRHMFRYPFFDDITSHTMSFSSRNPGQEYIMLRLWKANSMLGRKGRLLGSGAAILHDGRSCFGSQRESLIREHSMNVVSSRGWILASISFTYVKIDPFPGLSAPQPSHAWDSVQIHGHRGT